MLEKYSELIASIKLSKSALILGNGSSISISANFSYPNLYTKASVDNDFPTTIFDKLNTSNFESVIYQLDIAQMINEAITESSPPIIELNQIISNTSTKIRQALIQTIRSIHPEYSYLDFTTLSNDKLIKLFRFLTQFKYIINLNYDLLVYYILLHDTNKFIDFFLPDHNRDNKLTFHESISGHQNTTRLYYPHGNILLGVNSNGEEEKIRQEQGISLLSTIFSKWSNDIDFYPLFVCEGSSKEKVNSISNNYYLSYIYRNVLPQLPKTIVCYGWSLSENDEHILKQILKNAQRDHKLLISIRTINKSDFQVEAECTNIKNRINNINNNTEIHFFDSSDEGCWLNYNAN
ncbi:MAG: DUF4917 family protein [Veillonella parvula]|nr:DUF4917 family protein [Veillonella parvula]